MQNTLLNNNFPLQIINNNVPGARPSDPFQGAIVFLNLWMGQNQNAPIALDSLFKYTINKGNKIGQIIEIGTCHGGLSSLIGLFACAYGCKFITYDINDHKYHDLFKRLSIDFRRKDVFENEKEVRDEIENDNVTILLCDGGDKIKEFNLFASSLKTGDIILAHDYAPDLNYFESFSKNNTWSFFEIGYENIKNAIEKNGLSPLLEETFVKAAMCCFIKL